jgi:phosphatidylserine decarboxylase
MNRLTNAEIADDGWPLLALAGVVTIIVSAIALPVGCFLLGLMVWLAHILRVPERQTPTDENLVIAPTDGRVVQINNCPADTGVMPLPYDSLRITIRTRRSDTQLHTSPLTGHLTDNCLFPGLFASWPDIDREHGPAGSAHWEDMRNLNERRELTLCNTAGDKVILVQLATKTARQLVCRLAEGKYLSAGQPLGMARLAGVTDIYLPAHSHCQVTLGQHVFAAETILARLPSNPAGGG